MHFPDALEAAIFAELPIAREGWNGKGMFVYAVKANAYSATSKVAKDTFGEQLVPYGAYLAIKGADDTVYPWAPSQADIFANDWIIVTA